MNYNALPALLRDPKICVTPDTQSAFLTKKLLKMLSERPELRRYNAASLVREILAQGLSNNCHGR